MALCSRCLAIPLQSLPPPRPWYTSGPAVGSWEIPYLCCEREIDEELEDQLGYPWHPDLGSLAASASSCILCQVVHKGFKHWLAKYKEAKAQWAFGKYSRASKFLVPEGQVLYLTQRFGGGPGFNILVERSDCWEDIYILPGVCFSVDESKLLAHHYLFANRTTECLADRSSYGPCDSATPDRCRLRIRLQPCYCSIVPDQMSR